MCTLYSTQTHSVRMTYFSRCCSASSQTIFGTHFNTFDNFLQLFPGWRQKKHVIYVVGMWTSKFHLVHFAAVWGEKKVDLWLLSYDILMIVLTKISCFFNIKVCCKCDILSALALSSESICHIPQERRGELMKMLIRSSPWALIITIHSLMIHLQTKVFEVNSTSISETRELECISSINCD